MRLEKRVGKVATATQRGLGPMAATGVLLLSLAALALPVRAETVIKSHGISTFGDLALPRTSPICPM